MAVEFDFGADDGFNAGFGGGLGEFDCAVEIVFVGQSDGGEVVALGQVNDGVDGKGGVEEGVVAVEVERDGRGMTNDE